MGQQQLLLIILGVIIVGIAIAVGIALFSGQSVKANQDAIMADLNNILADAYQYRIRPSTMGGGNGAYTGWTISANGPWGTSNPNATYTATVTADQVTIVAESKPYADGSITASIDATGKITMGKPTGFPQ